MRITPGQAPWHLPGNATTEHWLIWMGALEHSDLISQHILNIKTYQNISREKLQRSKLTSHDKPTSNWSGDKLRSLEHRPTFHERLRLLRLLRLLRWPVLDSFVGCIYRILQTSGYTPGCWQFVQISILWYMNIYMFFYVFLLRVRTEKVRQRYVNVKKRSAAASPQHPDEEHPSKLPKHWPQGSARIFFNLA